MDDWGMCMIKLWRFKYEGIKMRLWNDSSGTEGEDQFCIKIEDSFYFKFVLMWVV